MKSGLIGRREIGGTLTRSSDRPWDISFSGNSEGPDSLVDLAADNRCPGRCTLKKLARSGEVAV